MRSRPNKIKQRLREGKTAFGVNVQTSSLDIVEMVGAAGFDYAMLDWEHGSYGFDTLVNLIRAAEAYDLTPIVRVPEGTSVTIMRVLDAGAMGIVVPQVDTREQAEEALRAARFYNGRNQGSRGACPSTRGAGHLVNGWQSFMDNSNEEIFMAIGFESEQSIRNFSEIASVPGMDAAFLGAFDLAQSMGYPGEMYHPAVMERLQVLLDSAKLAKMPVFGTLVAATPETTRQDAAKWMGLGARILNVISDRRLMSLGLQDRFNAVRAT
jgi:4-hydroxy-2-oxoheptanedioate aldolase